MACVDPHADALSRVDAELVGVPRPEIVTQKVDDLDGDGASDTLVALQELCGATGNCTYSVYLSGAGCVHYAGEVGGVMVGPSDGTHHGVRDLETYWKGGCVAMEGAGSTLAFDGTEYRTVDSYSCDCPTNEPAPRDPRCPSAD